VDPKDKIASTVPDAGQPGPEGNIPAPEAVRADKAEALSSEPESGSEVVPPASSAPVPKVKPKAKKKGRSIDGETHKPLTSKQQFEVARKELNEARARTPWLKQEEVEMLDVMPKEVYLKSHKLAPGQSGPRKVTSQNPGYEPKTWEWWGREERWRAIAKYETRLAAKINDMASKRLLDDAIGHVEALSVTKQAQRSAEGRRSHCKNPASRTVLELCCEEGSRMGRQAPRSCTVKRFTKSVDLTSAEGVAEAILAAENSPNCLIWIAVPCTGGSSFQRINAKFKSHRIRMRRHRQLFDALWAAVELIADACSKAGGRIAMEWPTGCKYWKH
jgi:hypothetical protein